MIRPTIKSMHKAAKKSKRAAIDSGIQKYVYLLQLDGVDWTKFISGGNSSLGYLAECALCRRFPGKKKCPLWEKCGGECIPEWHKMNAACRNVDYSQFIYNAGLILIRLLKLKGIVK